IRAVICPLMVRIRFSDISFMSHYLEPGRKRFGRIDPQCVESRCERRAFYHGNNSLRTAQVHCLQDATDKSATNNALMDKLAANFQFPTAKQMGESRGGTGAAGRAIDGAIAVKHRIASIGTLPFGLIGPHDVTDAPDRWIERVYGLHRLAHQVSDNRAQR